MSVHYVPPRDPNEARLEQIREAISTVLQSHISGRGKDTKIKKAADDIIVALKPLLKLPAKPDKGATVMTEASSLGRKKPNNL